MLYPALHNIRRDVVKKIKKFNINSLIDFCCGTGNQLKYLQKAGYEDIIGVDLSENMISQTKKGKYKPKCLLQDASNTNFKNNVFDAGIISFALHEKNIEIAKKIISEAKRIIKKNGFFIIVDYCYDKKTYFPGKWGTTIVEFFAGGEHYANFKKFIAIKGLNFLMKNFNFIYEKKYLFGSVRMRIYKF